MIRGGDETKSMITTNVARHENYLVQFSLKQGLHDKLDNQTKEIMAGFAPSDPTDLGVICRLHLPLVLQTSWTDSAKNI